MPSITISVLNIVAEEHNPEFYNRLLQETQKLNRFVTYRKPRVAKIAQLKPSSNKNQTIGALNTYVRLNPNDAWYDEASNDVVDSQRGVGRTIPSHLHPGFRRASFVFDSNLHRLFFESMNINQENFSPVDVARSFSLLFDSQEIKEQFGIVDVTPEPAPDAIAQILSLNGLSKLTIRLTKPNPDDFASDEAEWSERLQKIGARMNDDVYYKDRKADRIQPDETIVRKANVAAENGFVEATGLDSSGRRVVESTRNRPLKTRVEVGDTPDAPLEGLFSFIERLKLRP